MQRTRQQWGPRSLQQQLASLTQVQEEQEGEAQEGVGGEGDTGREEAEAEEEDGDGEGSRSGEDGARTRCWAKLSRA